VLSTYINGQLVAKDGKSLINKAAAAGTINNFSASSRKLEEFAFSKSDFSIIDGQVPVIEALDGQ
jgi:hypothetical protein